MTEDYQNLNVRMPREMMLKLRELKREARMTDKSITVADVVSAAVTAYYEAQRPAAKKFTTGSKDKKLTSG
jgi:hypothetical protein